MDNKSLMQKLLQRCRNFRQTIRKYDSVHLYMCSFTCVFVHVCVCAFLLLIDVVSPGYNAGLCIGIARYKGKTQKVSKRGKKNK